MLADPFHTALKARLQACEWPAGQRLPSIRQFVAEGDASYHQVTRAFAQLASEGLLSAQPGRGHFVTPLAQALAVSASEAPVRMQGDALFKLLQGGPHLTKLGCGWLPAAWRDTELLAKAIRRTARLEQSALAEYGDISGYLPLRKQLSVHLKRQTRLDVPPDQLLTTLGATQALDLITRLLIQPGDHVLVDEPCNGNLVRLIQLAGGHVVGIRRTAEGPDIEEMQQYLARHKVRAFYCNSTYHNPTGGNLSPHNAFKVLRLASEHDFMVVEDDVYGDFNPHLRQTFAELDNLERTLYVGSFSKCLSASLRVGYIACPAHLVEPLTRLKLLTCVAVPAFCERFVNTILVDGTYAGHMKQLQQKLIAQQVRTQQALARHGWELEMQPQGGMFLWAWHPQVDDQAELISRLERHDILLMPGASFSVGRDYRRYLRINCTHFTPAVGKHFKV